MTALFLRWWVAGIVLFVMAGLGLAGAEAGASGGAFGRQIARAVGLAGPEWKLPKLESALAELALDSGVAAASRLRLDAADGRVRVIVEATDPESAAAAIAAAGGSVESRAGNLVQAQAPLTQLRSLAGARSVRYIRRPAAFQQYVTSEGVRVAGAAAWHGVDRSGQGAKVAVLDTGFAGYEALLGTELPQTVVTRSFRADRNLTPAGLRHGTASAEVVHDVAPGAGLYLVNFETEVELAGAVDWLVAEQVHVISFGLGNPIDGPGDGTGFLADLVSRANLAGILWVNAAGNLRLGHWAGPFADPDGDGLHNFSGQIQFAPIELTAGERVTIALKWDDWQGRTEDLDLYVYDAGGAVVGRSQTEQNGAAPPTERIDYTPAASGLHQIVIQRFKGTRAVELDLYTEPQRLGNYWVPRRSLTIPADSPRALAVGATAWANDQLEEFSSQGPTFDGRLKPDLTAPDGVMNATTGAFTGTSAAAPHVAGAAALLKAANPGLGPERLRSVLEAWAADRGAPGRDNAYGAGRLRLAGPTAALPNDPVALDSVFTIDATAGAGGSRKAHFQAGETLGYRVDFRTLAPNVTVSIQFDAHDEASAETGERDITLSCRPRSQTLAEPGTYIGACDHVVDANQLPGDYTVRATITVADPAGARTYVQTALFTILPAPPGPTPTPKPVPQHRVLLPVVLGRNVLRTLAAPTVGQSLGHSQIQIYRRRFHSDETTEETSYLLLSTRKGGEVCRAATSAFTLD